MYIKKSVYPLGKKKCLTFSYDDNRNKANVRLVELFGNCVINPSLVDVCVKADGEVVKIAAGETKYFN